MDLSALYDSCSQEVRYGTWILEGSPGWLLCSGLGKPAAPGGRVETRHRKAATGVMPHPHMFRKPEMHERTSHEKLVEPSGSVLVSFVILTQARVTWEDRPSVEELPLSDWPVWGAFS